MRRILLLAVLAAQANADPKSDIGKVREQWGGYLHGKQMDEVLSLYADDAVFYLPQGGHMDGIPAIRSLFTTIMQTFDSDIHFYGKKLEVSRELAIDAGDYEETLVNRASGAKIDSKGSYLMVLRRGRDGHWKISRQMWTGIPPDMH